MIEFPYTSIKDENKTYLGVTTWLSSFEPPFDAIKIATMVSKNSNSEYYGMEVNSIIQLWNDTATRGNQKHKEIEDWLMNGKEKNSDCQLIEDILGITPENSWAELKLYNNELLLTGKPDIIQLKIENDVKVYYIHDIKTFTKCTTDKLEKASKQILVYAKMLREIIDDDNVKIRPGEIIVIRPKSNISEGTTYSFHDPEFYKIHNVMKSLKGMILNRVSSLGK